jgi:hypothetical protein
MFILLYHSKEFRHISFKERKEAAWQARQSAMRHWQFWIAIAGMIAATVIGSLVTTHLFGDEKDAGLGAGIGFVFGMLWCELALYRVGMPYYREILRQREATTNDR